MNIDEVRRRIRQGEDSVTQFKRQSIGIAKLADEMVAFANAEGGVIFFGVDDDGTVIGLNAEEKKLINRDLSNAATDGVRPAIYPRTEFHEIDGRLILAVFIPEGVSKPYANKSGEYWTKAGPDKRRVTARDELQRMLQNSLLIHADELPVRKTSASDIDLVHFGKFIRMHFDCDLDELLKREGIGLEQLLNNLGLADGSLLTLAGVMLFGKFPQKNHAQFMVKAVSFVGNDSAGSYYRDSEDITGTIAEMYRGTISFLKRNLRHVQAGQGFNSLGILEIPEEALQELVVNMFMHRDYFVEAPWRVFIFDNRIEIISPGCLPNHLTIEKMKAGVSCSRNATITSFAAKELPYRGLGTGVKRAVEVVPSIQFESNRDANWMKATIERSGRDEKGGFRTKADIDGQKADIDGQKADIEARKADIEAHNAVVGTDDTDIQGQQRVVQNVELLKRRLMEHHLTQPTITAICKLYQSLGPLDVVNRSKVMKIVGLGKTRATELIARMKSESLLVPVRGMGKGQYRFAL